MSLTHWQAWALTVATVAAGLLVLARRRGPSSSRVDRDRGLLPVVALLAAPLGWLYYIVFLAPLLATIVARWAELSRWPRRLLLAALPLLWAPHVLTPLYSEALWSRLTLRAMPTCRLLLVMLALALPAGSGSGTRAATGTAWPPAG